MTVTTDEANKPRKRNSTKGARTRVLIKRIARQVFEREGHSGATAQAIVEDAGISSGTFYIYFANKDEVLLEICSDFINELISALARSYTGSSVFENIYLSNYAYLKPIADNWLFYRALLSYALAKPDLREIIHGARLSEAKRTRKVIKFNWDRMGSPRASMEPKQLLQMALMLNAMTEGYIQDMLRGFNAEVIPSDKELRDTATMLGRIFYRAAYLDEPSELD
jgi:TetR/AcrR family transcriptional regulator, ethionamide resistance regulator